LGDGFKTLRIVYFANFDDEESGRLGLGMEPLNRRRTNPDPREN
jgi:hypothetical protein